MKASFLLDVGYGPVRGHGSPDEKCLLCFDLREPNNSQSFIARNFGGDGPERFFSTRSEKTQRLIAEAAQSGEKIMVVSSPFRDGEGCHRVLLALKC